MQNGANTVLYRQVERHLLRQIFSGIYPVGTKIPPEPVLMREHGVSITTLRRAVEELCRSGLLVKHQGKGTFVCACRRKVALVAPRASRSWQIMEDGLFTRATALNMAPSMYYYHWSSCDEFLAQLEKAVAENSGAILFPPYHPPALLEIRLSEIARRSYPLVILEHIAPVRNLHLPSVAIDYYTGFMTLIHKLACPSSQTAVLLDPAHPTAAALSAACARRKIPEKNIVRGNFMRDRAALYAALDKMFLQVIHPPRGLVCFASSITIAACTYLMRKGKLPERDYTLAAAGNLDDLKNLAAPLWALQLPRYEMGVRAAELLQAMLFEQASEKEVRLMPTVVFLNERIED